MALTPEVKAQLAEQKKQCVYCKIINKEIPAKTVFEDNITLALLDIYPAKKGHLVFTLKEHYPIVPLIPAEEFAHFFGLVPALSRSLQSAMVATGITLFIANGGVAGQQFPHFLAHIFPRDQGDGFYNFLFKAGKTLPPEKVVAVQRQLLGLMQNYFTKNPQTWHSGAGQIPSFLQSISNNNTIIYEDEKVVVIFPEKGVVAGHFEVYSKLEQRDVTKLSQEDGSHLFFVVSFVASALFDGLAAQGTNIILKSGFSDDNPEGRLCVHILPRMQNDSLQSMLWEPKKPEYDLDEIAAKIKDKMWNVKYKEIKREEVKTENNLVPPKPLSSSPSLIKIGGEKKPLRARHEEEIEDAIARIMR